MLILSKEVQYPLKELAMIFFWQSSFSEAMKNQY